jgi:ubiquinone/menaquinone biosynthesis C-methylase UbiE
MNTTREFSFGDDSIARAYDNLLVPHLFEPWASRVIEENQPWDGLHVLDLATGTGIVANLLAKHVGSEGKVSAIDINSQMLALARERSIRLDSEVVFIECSAHSLNIPSDSIDVVICQQGFQFFPNKEDCTREIRRVLRDKGKFIATTWRSVAECQFFGVICDALDAIGKTEISEMMRVPFDYMSASELAAPFEANGFVNVLVSQQEQDLVIDGGESRAIDLAYATPIGPALRALPDGLEEQFKRNFDQKINILSPDGLTLGRMVTNVLTANKQA